MFKCCVIVTITLCAVLGHQIKEIDTPELLKYQKDPNVLIIDVRGVEEIVQDGGILPGAINIPLSEVEEALSKSPEKFLSDHKVAKPEKDQIIVFSCKIGRRGAAATALANQLGYKNAVNYKGAWVGWQEYVKSKSLEEQSKTASA